MSSANMQNISFIRKWAASWAAMPRTRMPSASWPKRSAASSVMASVVWPGRSDSGSVKTLAEDVEVGRLGEAGEVEGVDLLGRAGEVGVDLEAVHVADDQQRRVFQVLAVQEQLLVGGGQVLVLALVLPAEVAAHPDVGPAVAAVGLVDAALEGVPGAVGVGLGRLGLAEQVAQVEEVLLAGGALGERHLLPLGDEFLRSHPGERRRRGAAEKPSS